jgi:hypothetical protein
MLPPACSSATFSGPDCQSPTSAHSFQAQAVPWSGLLTTACRTPSMSRSNENSGGVNSMTSNPSSR